MLEITETALLADDERVSADLAALRELGLHIAIDDFGTGYSSLDYLRRHAIDVLKIDRSFINGIESSGRQAALVGAIVHLAQALDLRVVAEGVETSTQRDALLRAGCRLGQGTSSRSRCTADEIVPLGCSPTLPDPLAHAAAHIGRHIATAARAIDDDRPPTAPCLPEPGAPPATIRGCPCCRGCSASSPMMDAVIDEVRGRRIRVGDHWLADFASCNYLGFDLDPEIAAAIDEQVRPLGHAPELVAAARQPAALPRDRGAADRAPGRPRHARAADHHPHPHLGAARARRRRHRPAGGAGAPDDLRRRDGSPPRPARRSTASGSTTSTGWPTCCAARRPRAPRVVVRRRGQQHDRQPARPARCSPGSAASTARCSTSTTPTASACSANAHPDETSPYGRRGNAVVRYFGETYDDIVLVGGFSKAYSSLLAFLTVPTWLKEHLKVAAPPYLYSGPSPTASLATVLAGFEVNSRSRRRDPGRPATARPSACSTTSTRSACTRPNVSGTPIVEIPLADADDLDAVGRLLWDAGIYVTLAAYPLVPRDRGGLPGADDRGQHRRRDRRAARRDHRPGRPVAPADGRRTGAS